MSLHNLIASGGKVLIIGGSNRSWLEYREHPQLVFWTGDAAEVMRMVKSNSYPSNWRALIVSRFIGHKSAIPVMDEARRRRVLIFAVKNDGQITKTLEEIVSPPQAVKTTEIVASAPVPLLVKEQRQHGWLIKFVEKHHQTELITAREGERLFEIITAQGMKTTANSVKQAVGSFRKKIGLAIGPKAKSIAEVKVTPKAAKPKNTERSNINGLVDMIDELQLSLSLIREEVLKINSQSAEHVELKRKLADLLK